MTTPQAPVVICMGSQSDWDTMQEAATILEELGIGFESRIISAHRTPGRLSDFASTAAADGVKVIIAGAAGLHICRACWQPIHACRFWACRSSPNP